MGWLVDIVLGSITRGVNKPTLFLFNLASVGSALTFGALVFTDGTPPELLPHLAVLLLFAVGLIASVNWVVAQTGTVSAATQQAELLQACTPPNPDAAHDEVSLEGATQAKLE